MDDAAARVRSARPFGIGESRSTAKSARTIQIRRIDQHAHGSSADPFDLELRNGKDHGRASSRTEKIIDDSIESPPFHSEDQFFSTGESRFSVLFAAFVHLCRSARNVTFHRRIKKRFVSNRFSVTTATEEKISFGTRTAASSLTASVAT